MTGKILVVEDDEMNRKLFVSLLRERGYDVLEAADGRQAVEEIEKEEPSLILMDIVLPQMNGFDVLRICKEKGLLHRSKVFALTASEMPEINGSGFDGVITKPVKVMDFLKMIERIWESDNP
jgi:two-component system cell cycle response regulator DivK